MASFNTVATMRRILRIPAGDESYTDAEIQSFLDEAQADMFSEIKREKELDTFLFDYNKWGAVQTEHKFLLAPVNSIFEILSNGVVIDSGDYTLNADKDVVTFDASIIALGEQIELYYIPETYTSAERYLCAFNMKVSSNLLNQNGNASTITVNYENKYKRAIQTIKNKIQMQTFV